MASSHYMIYRPERVGFDDLVRLVHFKRRLSDCKFIESSQENKLVPANARTNWFLATTIIMQKILLLIDRPLRIFGFLVEFSLNLVSQNGGIFGLIFHIITCSLVIPGRDSEKYRSFIGHIDGRLDLYKASSFFSHLPHMSNLKTENNVKLMDLCMMASKVAFENEAYMKNAVINHWKMHFVGFYDCWNVYLQEKETQAFIFTDKAEDASLIIVSFRGTEPFNGKDWLTDMDLSWISMGKMGKVHLGFMKALGLQDERNYLRGWPKNYRGEEDKPLAYYIIRDTLNSLLKQHKNAKIILTGHSLGGALSVIFPSILILHEETSILKSLVGVLTFGQPRVGDETFGRFIETHLNSGFGKWCYRVVYRYDVIPRMPFDDPTSQFKHFGYCIYFSSWYRGQVMREEPNKNFFDPKYLPSEYINAWKDLIKSFSLDIKEGSDFKESGVSLLFRLIGLIIPGVGSHSPRDYLNAARLGTSPYHHTRKTQFSYLS